MQCEFAPKKREIPSGSASAWHTACYGPTASEGKVNTSQRKHERVRLFCKAKWDFFTGNTGPKAGFVTDISQGGCLLKVCEPIEHRRWLRILVNDNQSNVHFSLVGRVVRCESQLEAVTESELSLFRYGIQFTHPAFVGQDGQDLIFALSRRNFRVFSCLSRNTKSSLRPGFFA